MKASSPTKASSPPKSNGSDSDYNSEVSGSSDNSGGHIKSNTSIRAISQSSAGGTSDNSSATSVRRLSVGSMSSAGSINSRISKLSKQSKRSNRAGMKMQSIDETTGPLTSNSKPSQDLFNITSVNKNAVQASPKGKVKPAGLGGAFGFSSQALGKLKNTQNERAQIPTLDEPIREETPREVIAEKQVPKSPRPSARDRSYSKSPRAESRDRSVTRSPRLKQFEAELIDLESMLKHGKSLPDAVASFLLSQIVAQIFAAKQAPENKKRQKLPKNHIWLQLSASNIMIDKRTLRVTFNKLPSSVVEVMNSQDSNDQSNNLTSVLQALASSNFNLIDAEAMEMWRLGELFNQMLSGSNSKAKNSPAAQDLLSKMLTEDPSQRHSTIYTQQNPSQQSKKTQGLKALFNDKYFKNIQKKSNLLHHIKQSGYKNGVCTQQMEKAVFEWHYEFLDVLKKAKN